MKKDFFYNKLNNTISVTDIHDITSNNDSTHELNITTGSITDSIINNKRKSEIQLEKCKNIGNIMSITTNTPLNYHDVFNSPEKENWKKAIKNELCNLYYTNIIKYVKKVPNNKDLISTKWIFTTKRDENNNIFKYKTRLVARGFKQIKGQDYSITYSPTLSSDSIKLIITLAAKLLLITYNKLFYYYSNCIFNYLFITF